MTTAADGEPSLPKGWITVSIGQACNLNPGKPSIDALPKGAMVTFVPMPAVDEDLGAITNPKERPYDEVRKGFTSFQNEDVIFAKITPCMENGKAAIARHLTNGLGFGSTEFHVLRPIGVALPEYLYHFVRQQSFRDAAAEQMTGSVGQKRVPADYLRNSFIPLAPLDEQRRIVARIEAILALGKSSRDRLTRVPGMIKRFREAVVTAACIGELTKDWREATQTSIVDQDIPVTWSRVTVETVIDGLKYGTSKKCDYIKQGVPVLRIPNIGNGSIKHDDMKYAELESREITQLALTAGDLLMIRSNGSVSLLGKTALVSKDEEGFAYAGYLIRLRPLTTHTLPAFLHIRFPALTFVNKLRCPQGLLAVSITSTATRFEHCRFRCHRSSNKMRLSGV